MERKLPAPGEKFIHFKNKMYQIICIAEHSETGEKLVVYQRLYGDFSCYVRPLAMFMSEVDHEKYPEVKQKYRFERMNESNLQNIAEDMHRAEAAAVAEEAYTEETVMEEQADPALLAFLDADTLEEKYNVLVSVQGRITDYLIDSFAVCLDVVIPEGEVRMRYQQLLSSVRTMQKYENTRLR